MPAPKGHPLWGNPIKPKKYTPEELWNKAQEYFNWCDKNPWIKKEQSKVPQRLTEKMALNLKSSVVKKFLSQTVDLPTQRPYTIEGLCRYINITRETFDNYSKTEGYETYFDICKAIRDIIDNNYLEGGLVGAFNSNIVRMKLGLIEKRQTELLTPNINISVTNEQTKKNIEKLSE